MSQKMVPLKALFFKLQGLWRSYLSKCPNYWVLR